MISLRSCRTALGLSQSRLARIAGVSRFKICTYELGDGFLTQDDQDRIQKALQAEAERLRGIPGRIDIVQFQSAGRTSALSHAEVAHITGISVAQLAAIEKGVHRPTAEEFGKVVEALSLATASAEALHAKREIVPRPGDLGSRFAGGSRE